MTNILKYITLIILIIVTILLSTSCVKGREDTSYDKELNISEIIYNQKGYEYVIIATNKAQTERIRFLKSDYFNKEDLTKLKNLLLGKNIVVLIETNGTSIEISQTVYDTIICTFNFTELEKNIFDKYIDIIENTYVVYNSNYYRKQKGYTIKSESNKICFCK